MPINCCTNGGVVVTAAVLALLLLPVQYLPDLSGPEQALVETVAEPLETPPDNEFWYELWLQFSSVDLVITVALVLAGTLIYLSEWIQRKLLERRITKLNQCLCARVARLRAWDARQERLEGALRVVRSATCEYKLLLYLLLRGAEPELACQGKPLHDTRVC